MTVIKNLLQSVTGITKCDKSLFQVVSGITKCDRSLLHSASGVKKCERLLLQSALGITKCDSYYKGRQKPVNEWILTVLKIHNPPQIFIFLKLLNSTFYTAWPRIKSR